MVDKDEGPRADTTLEKLAALKPVFDPTGTVTAGNASPLNDGAAAVVLMAADEARKQGSACALLPRVRRRGVPPAIMGIGPVPAVRKLLAKAGLKIDQIDLYEVNEAFASQALYCLRELALPLERVNVNGGAIALGHPLGCTGARQIATGAARARAPQGQVRRHHDVRGRRHGRRRVDRTRGVGGLVGRLSTESPRGPVITGMACGGAPE